MNDTTANVNKISIKGDILSFEYQVDYKHGYKTEETKKVNIKLLEGYDAVVKRVIKRINTDVDSSLSFGIKDIIMAMEGQSPSAINRFQWNPTKFNDDLMKFKAKNDIANRCCFLTFTAIKGKETAFIKFWNTIKNESDIPFRCWSNNVKSPAQVKLIFDGFH